MDTLTKIDIYYRKQRLILFIKRHLTLIEFFKLKAFLER